MKVGMMVRKSEGKRKEACGRQDLMCLYPAVCIVQITTLPPPPPTPPPPPLHLFQILTTEGSQVCQLVSCMSSFFDPSMFAAQ